MHSLALSRRRFARTCFTAAGAVLGAPAFLRAQNLNSKLRVAIIGCGGRGGANLGEVAKLGAEIVALCDVNGRTLEGVGAKYPQARREKDFRRLFEKTGDFDAAVVSTCEHTHAWATMLALRAGKHVYCEKPLTHGVWEARQIREAAAKAKVATQMGIQIHATENYRRVVELIQGGAIGAVAEAHVWVGRAWGWQSPEDAAKNKDIVAVRERPAGSSPVPAGLDWDLWLGPAPERPFHEVYWPGPKWYRWWDFGSGTMSDLGSHWVDLPFWALKLDAPRTIEASGPPPHPEIAPATMRCIYEYAARGEMPAARVVWYQGAEKPDMWKAGAIPQWDSGCLFLGEKGMLLASYDKYALLPEEEFKDFKAPAPTIPRVAGHQAEWVAACASGAKCSADFDYSARLTEANHLGSIAYRLGKKLAWDAAALRATNAPEADALIRRAYRAGWTL